MLIFTVLNIKHNTFWGNFFFFFLLYYFIYYKYKEKLTIFFTVFSDILSGLKSEFGMKNLFSLK